MNTVHKQELIQDVHTLHKMMYLAEGINLMGEYPAIDEVVHDVYHAINTVVHESGSEYIGLIDLGDAVASLTQDVDADQEYVQSILEYVATVTYGMELVV